MLLEISGTFFGGSVKHLFFLQCVRVESHIIMILSIVPYNCFECILELCYSLKKFCYPKRSRKFGLG